MIRRAFLLLSFLCISCQPGHLAKINSIRDLKLAELNYQVESAHFRLGSPTFIRVFKDENILEVWMQATGKDTYALYKTYPICAYSGLLGPKHTEGDNQAPEGFYDITEERLWPGSKYHLAMNIGYPNAYDKAHRRTGSNIMIHGACKSEGCFAMTDSVIEEIYLLVEQSILSGQDSVPVHVFPFRMTTQNMAEFEGEIWNSFWRNLKQGYDLFEINKIPPNIKVKNKRYAFPNFYIPRRQKPQLPQSKPLKPAI
ncbi:MAG: murein L,D-transpeptidase family protein [Pseudomonadota bacterium]